MTSQFAKFKNCVWEPNRNGNCPRTFSDPPGSWKRFYASPRQFISISINLTDYEIDQWNDEEVTQPPFQQPPVMEIGSEEEKVDQ